MRKFTITSLLALMAGGAFADDVAVIIGNEDYAHGRDIANAGEMFDAVPNLESAGFDVIEAEDATATGLQEVLARLEALADGTGRVVIAVAGHVVNSEDGAWMLGTDADTPDVVSVARDGVPIDLLLEIAGRSPGQAVVLVGTEDRKFDLGSGLDRGLSLRTVPQGVTVISGDAGQIADFAKDALTVQGQSLAVAMQDWPDLTMDGFVAPLVPFVMAGGAVLEDEDTEQKAYWTATQNIATQRAYQNYLDKYPAGDFVEDAQAEIARIASQPLLQAEEAENNLNLTRTDRQDIQRALSLVGFDPRGIDGIFGPGSRGAISAWQTDNRMAVTGYVTRSMRNKLDVQAERRAAELEEEARLRKLELEREDRAFWERTGAAGDEPGLRTYLERFPDGIFAEVAVQRLKPFEDAKREQAAGQDRAAWDTAQSSDTLQAYRDYVATQTQGAFVDQAQARIVELELAARNADAYAAAARNEQRLGMTDRHRRLVEERLEKLNLKPGRVDGVFDDSTRRALRRYQESRNLQKTGYVNQATAVRLLADSLLR